MNNEAFVLDFLLHTAPKREGNRMIVRLPVSLPPLLHQAMKMSNFGSMKVLMESHPEHFTRISEGVYLVSPARSAVNNANSATMRMNADQQRMERMRQLQLQQQQQQQQQILLQQQQLMQRQQRQVQQTTSNSIFSQPEDINMDSLNLFPHSVRKIAVNNGDKVVMEGIAKYLRSTISINLVSINALLAQRMGKDNVPSLTAFAAKYPDVFHMKNGIITLFPEFRALDNVDIVVQGGHGAAFDDLQVIKLLVDFILMNGGTTGTVTMEQLVRYMKTTIASVMANQDALIGFIRQFPKLFQITHQSVSLVRFKVEEGVYAIVLEMVRLKKGAKNGNAKKINTEAISTRVPAGLHAKVVEFHGDLNNLFHSSSRYVYNKENDGNYLSLASVSPSVGSSSAKRASSPSPSPSPSYIPGSADTQSIPHYSLPKPDRSQLGRICSRFMVISGLALDQTAVFVAVTLAAFDTANLDWTSELEISRIGNQMNMGGPPNALELLRKHTPISISAYFRQLDKVFVVMKARRTVYGTSVPTAPLIIEFTPRAAGIIRDVWGGKSEEAAEKIEREREREREQQRHKEKELKLRLRFTTGEQIAFAVAHLLKTGKRMEVAELDVLSFNAYSNSSFHVRKEYGSYKDFLAAYPQLFVLHEVDGADLVWLVRGIDEAEAAMLLVEMDILR